VVTGNVDEPPLAPTQQRLALPVPRAIGFAALVLDVVAEIDDEIGAHVAIHPVDERRGELRRAGGELAEPAFEPRLGTEVQIADEREREIYSCTLAPARMARACDRRRAAAATAREADHCTRGRLALRLCWFGRRHRRGRPDGSSPARSRSNRPLLP